MLETTGGSVRKARIFMSPPQPGQRRGRTPPGGINVDPGEEHGPADACPIATTAALSFAFGASTP
jgi:hypothetical protein